MKQLPAIRLLHKKEQNAKALMQHRIKLFSR